MSAYPRISIVTPSYNQGRFLAETIESVLRQDYPNVEHIVVDGMSTDETPEILKRYPHLRVIREPDQGQADAINKGFRIATGEIYAFLNSDDLLLPGALKRVAAEIRPQEGRHVIMGRCRFIDENSRYIGIEHPSHFESFERVLAIWKGHFIPQPAVFWTAEVWQRCGPCGKASCSIMTCSAAWRNIMFSTSWINRWLLTACIANPKPVERRMLNGWKRAFRSADSIGARNGGLCIGSSRFLGGLTV